jgi:hypothetical protein
MANDKHGKVPPFAFTDASASSRAPGSGMGNNHH